MDSKRVQLLRNKQRDITAAKYMPGENDVFIEAFVKRNAHPITDPKTGERRLMLTSNGTTFVVSRGDMIVWDELFGFVSMSPEMFWRYFDVIGESGQ